MLAAMHKRFEAQIKRENTRFELLAVMYANVHFVGDKHPQPYRFGEFFGGSGPVSNEPAPLKTQSDEEQMANLVMWSEGFKAMKGARNGGI